MGLFSRKVGRDSWGTICTDLTGYLEQGRERFFDGALALAGEGRSPINRKLGGKADLALKGYQLGLVSAILQERRYVDEKDAQEFVTLLYAQVCGARVQECIEYLDRYYLEEGRASLKLVRDVLGFIVCEENVDLAIAMGLLPHEFGLSASANIYTALVFGDEKRATDLMERAAKAAKEMAGRPHGD